MRLADLRVRHRIVALAVLPLTAAVLLTAPLVAERIQSAGASAQSAGELRLTQQVSGLIVGLQRERRYSSAYLANPNGDGSPIVRQTAQTDADVSELKRGDAVNGPPALTAALREVSALANTRRAVLARTLEPSEVNAHYGRVISALIDALPLSDTDDGSDRRAFGREQASMDALLRVNESSSSYGALLLAAASQPDQARKLLAGAEGRLAIENAEKDRFLRFASPSEADLFETVEGGNAATKMREYSDALTSWAYSSPDGGTNQGIRPGAATASSVLAAADSMDQLRLLTQNKIARDSSARASDNASETRTWTLLFTLAVVSLTAVMIWLTVRMVQSIVRPLAFLHGAAEQVAHVAEAELARVAEEGGPSADGQEPIRLSRVPTLSKDELGRLAVAFNRVQDAAASLIERQVRSRKNASAMLGNVGRRTQNLAALQLTMIDAIERGETDPALLESLYRLDHVSSRLRRYADSLVVLSGWTEPVFTSASVSLGELTRSALGKIEGFRRVRIVGEIPPLRVASHASADLSLAVAELLDNATCFSPPTAPVGFFAEMSSGGGCVLRIVDHGVGMPDARLEQENARLARPERLDLVSTEFLGLFVVGRLSRRHNFQVRLEHTPEGGVTAQLAIPAALLSSVGNPSEAPRGVPDGTAAPALAAGGDQHPTASVLPVPGVADSVKLSPGTPALTGVPPISEHPVSSVPGAGLLLEKALNASPPTGVFDWFDAGETRGARALDQSVNASGSAEKPDGPSTRALARRSSFADLAPGQSAPARDSAGVPAVQGTPELASRSGEGADKPYRLRRRVPGAHMSAGVCPPKAGDLSSGTTDPESARAMIEEFEAGVARATEAAPGSEERL